MHRNLNWDKRHISCVHPFFALLSLSKGKSLKWVHPSGMDMGVLFVSEFVSWILSSSGLNFLLLALLIPTLLLRFTRLFSIPITKASSCVCFSYSAWSGCAEFSLLLPFQVSYSPPLWCLRNPISSSGSSCRKLAYSSHHPYSYNLHGPLSRQSTAAKVKYYAQEAQHGPAYKVQTHSQLTESPYRNTLNIVTLHHHMWKTNSLLLQIS